MIEDGYGSGRLAGPSCKGDHKVTLLKEYLGVGVPPGRSYGYGDSRSDLPLLRWVRDGIRVRRHGIVPIASHDPSRPESRRGNPAGPTC
jgi:phosphoserine phosphatase